MGQGKADSHRPLYQAFTQASARLSILDSNLVLNALKENGIPCEFDAVIGRGGLLRPIPGGVYEVNDAMVADIKKVKPHRPLYQAFTQASARLSILDSAESLRDKCPAMENCCFFPM